jgi:hypothetical protein
MLRVFDSPRLLMKVTSVAVLWLLFASIGYAAPAPRRAAAGRVCDARATTLRKLSRPPKSVGGPVKAVSSRALAGLADPRPVLKRGSHLDLDDDGQAIQNDAPAARIDSDERSAPTSGSSAFCRAAPSPSHTGIHASIASRTSLFWLNSRRCHSQFGKSSAVR